jgi:hypothetical protein
MSVFVVHCVNDTSDRYDKKTFYWTVEDGGVLVVQRKGDMPHAMVAAYAPTWWTRITTEGDGVCGYCGDLACHGVGC